MVAAEKSLTPDDLSFSFFHESVTHMPLNILLEPFKIFMKFSELFEAKS